MLTAQWGECGWQAPQDDVSHFSLPDSRADGPVESFKLLVSLDLFHIQNNLIPHNTDFPLHLKVASLP